MNNHFRCIGIVGHPRHPTALTTHEMLYRWLCGKGYEVMVEQQIAQELQLKSVRTGTLAEIGQQADLAVVVGGDGNMLGAARTLARYDIKVIGVNRGNLGFLTDLDPDNAQQQLADAVGVSRQTIVAIEKGDYNPTIRLCICICQALGCTLDALFWPETEQQ